MKSPYMLNMILNIDRWQKLQDALSKITGLAIITVDYKGIPLTKHSAVRPFCSHVRNDRALGRLCQKCDSRGGLEAVRISQPYVYKCHCGIVDIAIPIIVDNQYIGAVMAGEVKIENPSLEDDLEKIYSHNNIEPCAMTPELRKMYDEIPSISNEALKTSISLLFELCNYLVEEAMNKNIILDMYEKLSGSDSLLSTSVPPASAKKIRHELGNVLTSAYIKSSASEMAQCTNKTLLPAFNYMYERRNTMLSQKDAAALCHISTGHFSRLFLKEAKENYSVFYIRLKIEWAKNLLLQTDLPVSQISEELGFNEPSYFTRVFHKYEGVTPAYFRKTARAEGKA